MSVFPCWEDVIGITRVNCAEYSIGATYKESNSGLYMDELIPFHKYYKLLNCENAGEIVEFMVTARDNAINDFIIDANNQLMRYARLKRLPFKGKIGKAKTTQVLSLTSGNYYGVRMFCSDVVGGEIYIKEIATIFDSTGVITLYIYNNLNELQFTIPLNTVANTLTVNNVTSYGIRLPLHSDYVDNLEYFFIYQLGANSPRDNGWYSSYNAASEGNKAHRTQTPKQYGWRSFINIGGFSRSDISDLSDITADSSSRMYGLILGCEMGCDVSEMWCKDELDFTNNIQALNMAKCIQYKTALNVINDLYLSKNLNRETMISGETLEEREELYEAMYKELLEKTVENADITATDCFECEDKMIIGKSNIKA